MDTPATRCRNCDTPLDGPFCANCGQRESRRDLHFAEAVGDMLGDIVTWDSRLWRTLIPLLFRPGFLSAEFNAGRRMRYVPPFRLYIIVSFLMFLVVSLTAGDIVNVGDWVGEEEAAVGLGLDPNDTPPASQATLDEVVDAKRADKLPEKKAGADADAVSAAEDIEAAMDPGSESDGFEVTLVKDGPPWVQELERRIEANADRVREDPSDYIDDLLEYLPQVMFVMLPLFALLLKLFYFFTPFHYLQHLVFALHYHTFVYLLYLISEAMDRASWRIDGLFAPVLFFYLLFALRRTYASGWFGALGKSFALMLSYGILLVLGMVIAALAVLAAM